MRRERVAGVLAMVRDAMVRLQECEGRATRLAQDDGHAKGDDSYPFMVGWMSAEVRDVAITLRLASVTLDAELILDPAPLVWATAAYATDAAFGDVRLPEWSKPTLFSRRAADGPDPLVLLGGNLVAAGACQLAYDGAEVDCAFRSWWEPGTGRAYPGWGLSKKGQKP